MPFLGNMVWGYLGVWTDTLPVISYGSPCPHFRKICLGCRKVHI